MNPHRELQMVELWQAIVRWNGLLRATRTIFVLVGKTERILRYKIRYMKVYRERLHYMCIKPGGTAGVYSLLSQQSYCMGQEFFYCNSFPSQ